MTHMRNVSRAIVPRFYVLTAAMVSTAVAATAQSPSACTTQDSASAAMAIRARLAQWVAQVNSGDPASGTIWAAPVAGWFPRGPEFSDSAAYATAGLNPSVGAATVTYAITVDEVAVSSRLAAVHDIWKEVRHFPGTTVTVSRQIRGSELWRCQPDGAWRIARWVSAPEHWIRS